MPPLVPRPMRKTVLMVSPAGAVVPEDSAVVETLAGRQVQLGRLAQLGRLERQGPRAWPDRRTQLGRDKLFLEGHSLRVGFPANALCDLRQILGSSSTPVTISFLRCTTTTRPLLPRIPRR